MFVLLDVKVFHRWFFLPPPLFQVHFRNIRPQIQRAEIVFQVADGLKGGGTNQVSRSPVDLYPSVSPSFCFFFFFFLALSPTCMRKAKHLQSEHPNELFSTLLPV